jgi:hypothetical protein
LTNPARGPPPRPVCGNLSDCRTSSAARPPGPTPSNWSDCRTSSRAHRREPARGNLSNCRTSSEAHPPRPTPTDWSDCRTSSAARPPQPTPTDWSDCRTSLAAHPPRPMPTDWSGAVGPARQPARRDRYPWTGSTVGPVQESPAATDAHGLVRLSDQFGNSPANAGAQEPVRLSDRFARSAPGGRSGPKPPGARLPNAPDTPSVSHCVRADRFHPEALRSATWRIVAERIAR